MARKYLTLTYKSSQNKTFFCSNRNSETDQSMIFDLSIANLDLSSEEIY